MAKQDKLRANNPVDQPKQDQPQPPREDTVDPTQVPKQQQEEPQSTSLPENDSNNSNVTTNTVKHSFRCKACGKLHTSDDAAEAEHPHACRVCGEGVSFNPKTGVKTLNPNNWEVLSEVDEGRLNELGLAPEHVKAHTKWEQGSKDPNPPRHVKVEANESTRTKQDQEVSKR
jgi:hypothetical protein